MIINAGRSVIVVIKTIFKQDSLFSTRGTVNNTSIERYITESQTLQELTLTDKLTVKDTAKGALKKIK